jgi:hypothetical protein
MSPMNSDPPWVSIEVPTGSEAVASDVPALPPGFQEMTDEEFYLYGKGLVEECEADLARRDGKR